ncbi:hypothetical protein AAHC03_05034 [Spirometra sp. Aus1]
MAVSDQSQRRIIFSVKIYVTDFSALSLASSSCHKMNLNYIFIFLLGLFSPSVRVYAFNLDESRLTELICHLCQQFITGLNEELCLASTPLQEECHNRIIDFQLKESTDGGVSGLAKRRGFIGKRTSGVEKRRGFIG